MSDVTARLDIEVIIGTGAPSRARAMAARVGSRWRVIINAATCPPAARRFQAAHELGHILLARCGAALDPAEAERWCNAFAAALLMPADDVRSHAMWPLDWLTRRFGVTRTAMRLRLVELGCLSAHERAAAVRRRASMIELGAGS
ncbi:MAG: ImmA/IrrE family metallo-endopeptidase [Sphaerobacter sp.]|nr:ImmA/IrrE family metallo-endopeptidase [Sphaerobacter sp.]